MSTYDELDEFATSVGADGHENADDSRVDQSQKRKDPPTSGAQPKKQQKVHETKPQENRAIYVTNIPRDATVDEIWETFKRYGMIDQGVDGKHRIKMYTDDNGDFNGEALIVYFRKESVAIAIDMMDDYEFRPGETSNGKVHVQEADLSFKKNKDKETISTKLVRKDRKAAERNRAEMNRKLAEWSDNEEEVREAYAPKKNKWSRFAIIKNAFQLYHLEDDDTAILEIKQDMREAAEKFGTVTKVVLYDKEPEGVLSVRFTTPEAAEAFRDATNGRRYNGDTLQITIAEDRPKFAKSSKGDAEDSEDDAQRLARFISNQDDEDTD